MLESLPSWAQEALAPVVKYLPTVAGAIGITVGGWIVALIVRRALFAALKRTELDQKAMKALGFAPVEGERLERTAASTVYYLLLGLVAVVLFDYLDLGLVTQPLLAALEGVASGVPNLLKAALIGGVGFLVATLLKALTTRLLDKTSLVERLAKLSLEPSEAESIETAGISKKAGAVVFWIVLGLTAIPVLEALRVGLLAEPLSAALHSVSTFLPRIVAASILLLVGYVLARTARALVKAVVDGLGLDARLKNWGLGSLLGETSIGSILGSVAMAFVFLHFAVAAVGRLGIAEVSVPLSLVLTQIYDYLPKLLVAAVLLLIAMAASRLISRGAALLLAAMGLNRLLEQIGLGGHVTPEARRQEAESNAAFKASSGQTRAQALMTKTSTARTPADISGMILGAVVFLLFAEQVLKTLELDTLSSMLSSFLGYLPNVLVAVCVLAAGMWAGRWSKSRIDTLTEKSSDRLMRSLGSVARIAIVVVASMVALEQLGVAERLIAIAFTVILGATALAFALAFGLGGREVAGRVLSAEFDRRKQSLLGVRPDPGE